MPAFISNRLKEAREARGLSITSLAELTDISKQSISSYEKGNNPSIYALTKIAQRLNMPIQFFYKPIFNRDNNPIFFRSLAAATKRVRLRAERRLNWLEEIIEYLGQYIYFRQVRLPKVDIDSDPNALSIHDIEDIAMKCRHEWGLGNGPISNMVNLLEMQGAIVIRDKLDSETLDSFSKWYAHKNVPIIILGDDKRSAVRSRMDAAHEAGHLIMHRSIDKIGKYFKLIEDQAFRFGSAFLLPAESFTKDFLSPGLDIFVMMKSKWKVAVSAMIRRCYDLNIIDSDRYEKLFIYYNKRGWRRKEPLDDTISIEPPLFLRKCIEMIIEKEVQSKENIAINLSLSLSDIEDMLNLPRGFLTGKSSIVSPLPQLKKTSPPHGEDSKGSIIRFPKKRGE